MENVISDLSLLLVGASILAYISVLLKQPIIIGYILCGVLIGPWGFGLIHNVDFIESISRMGIMLLLFLAGLCLHPQKLLGIFKETSLIVLINCSASFILAFSVSIIFDFSLFDSVCIGLAMMFSSTILVVKLLPTTKLHQQRMGAICIGVLILQDLLAILVLAFIRGISSPEVTIGTFGILFLKLISFIFVLALFERYILRNVMARVELIHEVLFVLGLAWCFGVASLSNHIGLFPETGAFFAGVVLARHKISFFISESLKPLRDFFLVLFFFSLGANINILVIKGIILQALVLAVFFIIVKSWIFKKAFIISGEKSKFSQEIGIRLGQLSEFALLISFLAIDLGQISIKASQFIQLTTILTFVISSYIVVFNYATPIGPSEKLLRD